MVKPTAKPSVRPEQTSPPAVVPPTPPAAAKATAPQQDVQSQVDEYMAFLKTRVEALSKRDDAEFDRMVQNAKKHPLFAEYVKYTSESACLEPEEYEFAEHEPLDEFAEWEW